MISASKAVYTAEGCSAGLPECGTPGTLVGVVSVDLYIPFMNHITSRIKTRETGEAHLFHVESGGVVSSPQWQAAPDDEKLNIKDVTLKQNTFGEAQLERMRT